MSADTPLRFSRRRAGAVTLHVAEAGPESGPLVILLHGFPEFWFGWRHQIDALAAAGYRVVAPDQRGYNLSDKPAGVAAYDLDPLASDIVALADSYGAKNFALVGHDWGAGVAWWVAQNHPRRVRKFAILNAPHPAIWRTAMDQDPEQRKLSWYVRVLGVPALPEFGIRAGRYRGLLAALRESKRALGDDEEAQYLTAWRQEGALTAMINWYRAVLRRRDFAPPPEASIEPPAAIIWGAKDRYSALKFAEKSAALCTRADLTVLAEATHWVQHDEAERVNGILLDFLK